MNLLRQALAWFWRQVEIIERKDLYSQAMACQARFTQQGRKGRFAYPGRATNTDTRGNWRLGRQNVNDVGQVLQGRRRPAEAVVVSLGIAVEDQSPLLAISSCSQIERVALARFNV